MIHRVGRTKGAAAQRCQDRTGKHLHIKKSMGAFYLFCICKGSAVQRRAGRENLKI